MIFDCRRDLWWHLASDFRGWALALQWLLQEQGEDRGFNLELDPAAR